MKIKKFVKIFFIFLIIASIIYFLFLKLFENKKKISVGEKDQSIKYNSNIIKDVVYKTRDKDGNEYYIKAIKGEIDLTNPNIIFLTDVYAYIKLNNSEEIKIVSDYGKYNSANYDTIFSKNLIINYLDNKITGGYLDFSLERNSMLISKNVIYSNPENILKADVVEINIKSKDTKIFMHEQKKKVEILSNF